MATQPAETRISWSSSKMAAKLRPERGSMDSHSHAYSLEALDRLCSSLCAILYDGGMPYRQATCVVASWIRPASRRRHYGLPLQTFKAAIQPRKHRRPQWRERDSSDPDAHARSHTHRTETAGQTQSPSNIPKYRTPGQHVTTLHSRAKAEHHTAAQAKTKQNPAGAGPTKRDSMQTTETTYPQWPNPRGHLPCRTSAHSTQETHTQHQQPSRAGIG
ncbi:Hypothetical predicted protein [Pelobates cultripes]|uniref:Uncharacterized protein n=1 Tax=Pelobates cultripes TaxID=61616 RepID=A0AAD1W9J8_PELCU|nr:Hypothetical predicted protein [Pelobates cultripes]